MKNSIAIVEDDLEIARIERIALTKEGYEVTCFNKGRVFLDSLKTQLPHLLVLDLMLPDIQGLDILKQLREDDKYSSMAIVIVSAKGLVSDKVEGLDLGADDYLEKPFSILELVSRVNARFRSTKAKNIYTIASFTLNEKAHTFTSEDGKSVDLTPKEWELLLIFLHHPNEALSRETLFNALWGEGSYESRTLDVHIASLRKKILDSNGRILETVYGVGYRYNV